MSKTEDRSEEKNSPVLLPMILGAAQIHFKDFKASLDFLKDLTFLNPVSNDPIPVRWDQAKEANLNISNLKTFPPEGIQFSELPPAATVAKNYGRWQRISKNG